MSVEIARHSFTVEEFERMGEACIFPPDARLELIEGEIVEMSPIGSPHAACVDALALLFNEIARRRFIIRVQSPVRLNDFSEPQPDVALLRWRDDFYRSAHPTPADVLLVVEVADTTAETDRKVKVPLYARAGIPEAWLVNIPDERIEVYSDPSGDSYRRVEHFGRGAEARSHTVAGLAVGVGELLG
ncbi:MAG: Uma2 family endonuclease [Acidobacteria bacterium]|nr:MAG: Uma2 family endonuclease [Acidobacteriota bacterium]